MLESKREKLSAIAILLFMGFFLGIRLYAEFNYYALEDTISYKTFVFVVLPAIFICLLLFLTKRIDSIISFFILTLAFLIWLVFTSITLFLNGALDKSNTIPNICRVKEKVEISTAKSTTYVLKFSSCDSSDFPPEIRVKFPCYELVREAQDITIYTHRGAFHIPWSQSCEHTQL